MIARGKGKCGLDLEVKQMQISFSFRVINKQSLSPNEFTYQVQIQIWQVNLTTYLTWPLGVVGLEP